MDGRSTGQKTSRRSGELEKKGDNARFLRGSGSAPCFNKGRLHTVVNSVSTSSFPCYDALGRATQSSQITAVTTYGFAYAHNLDSTLRTQSYPDGLTVAFEYDSAGRPTKAGRNTVGQIDFAQNVLYAPHGVPDQFTLGNGLTETTTYNNRLQPCTMTASTLLTLTFKYGATDSGNCDVESDDNNGNILQQVISASGNPTFTQKYTYDAVNRIKTVGENNDFWQRTYSYDAFGNRAATGSGITMGSPTPTAVTQFDAATNRITKLPTGVDLDPDPAITTDDPYDEAGNLVRHPIVGSMAYDANNKQRFYCTGHVTCTSGNAIAEYRYDGAGNRVEKVTSAETTTFVYDAFGKLAAEYSTTPPTNSGLFFRTLDHLGSTRLVTDAADPPSVVSRRDFLPFGEHIPADATFNRQALAGYNAGSAFRQQFTAKERDDESGLDYFGARYFGSSLGRFTSPDAPFLDQDPRDPQSWNLYTYVRNNPMKNIDPTGNCVEETSAGADATADQICRNVGELATSPEGRDAIQKEEATVLVVYLDTADNPTVGTGHLVLPEDNLKVGDTISEERADELLRTDLKKAEGEVRELVGSRAQLSQPEFDALVDLEFNVGPTKLQPSRSPGLNAAIDAEDYPGISNQLRYTLDSNGVQQRGLVRRSERRQERFRRGRPPRN